MRRHTTFSVRISTLLACLLYSVAVTSSTDSDFDDVDLATLVSDGARGVIYLWSPHMPYSVRGATEVRRVAETLGLQSVLLLDPYAEPALAAHAVRSNQLPYDAVRRVTADALSQRGATQHFPTVIVFAAGRLDALMLPGYTPPSDLRAFIEQRLHVLSPA